MNTPSPYPFTTRDSEREYTEGYREGRRYHEAYGRDDVRAYAISIRDEMPEIPTSAPRIRRRMQGRMVGLLTSAEAEARQAALNADIVEALRVV